MLPSVNWDDLQIIIIIPPTKLNQYPEHVNYDSFYKFPSNPRLLKAHCSLKMVPRHPFKQAPSFLEFQNHT